ncbi:site-specific integrase [Cronobacter turicensis]|uniref:site-specific integrase n=1 Tax=Cronobacter turicensis TaxID=413502 RepID=UPI0024C471F1|nr:site-specific integrase [Cronobacter turicensis]MDK1207803.1 site-specific integrase [Cronobacter turicensis]MDK1216103.1 site-specific integrase [Cronobacter turicensis]MDK1232617.1 site-specific integrase [Cronobacter turicensis]HDI3034268.1 site-specific integrase [Cronobacter turicensis]
MSFPTGVELHNGKIRISFTYRGTRCREVLKGWSPTPANIKKAGNLRAMIVSEIQLGQFSYAQRFPESKSVKKFTSTRVAYTWGELTKLWIDAKEEDVSRNTMTRIQAQLRTISRVIGDNTLIAEITHSDMMQYRKELLRGESFYAEGNRRRKTGRSVNTVNDYISLACQILRFAHRSRFITDKPFEHITKLHKDRKKPDPLQRDEYAKMMLALTGQDRNMWQFAINAGLRHGEIAALAWDDVDLELGKVHIRRNLTRLGDFVPPKTKAGDRIITLLAPALDALRAQYALTGYLPETEIIQHYREYGKTERQNHRFVFLPDVKTNKPGPHYQTGSISACWDAAVDKAKIRRRAPYQSRHTYACWSLAAGANPSFIASQLGHEDAEMVYRVYSAWIKEFDGDQVEMLNQKLGFAPNTPPASKTTKLNQ